MMSVWVLGLYWFHVCMTFMSDWCLSLYGFLCLYVFYAYMIVVSAYVVCMMFMLI